MANLEEMIEAPIPRPLLWIGTPIAAIVLIALFVFLRFPYDDLAGPIGHQLGALTGSQVVIGELDAELTIGGPGLTAQNIRVTSPDGRKAVVGPLRVRPAWSTAWFFCTPALIVRLDSQLGRWEGMLVVSDPPSWTGEIENVDLTQIPPAASQGVSLSGRLDGALDVILAPTGVAGPVSFDVVEGSVAHPSIPFPLAFDRATGDLTLGEDPVVDLRSLEIDGPMLFVSVAGQIRNAPRPDDRPIDMKIEMEIKDPNLRAMLQGMGIQLDGRGRSQFVLGGTVGAPRTR